LSVTSADDSTMLHWHTNCSWPHLIHVPHAPVVVSSTIGCVSLVVSSSEWLLLPMLSRQGVSDDESHAQHDVG
jgi:hypothetical protein